MTQPPRTAERLLEAIGAQAQLRDAVLGDLAEEFASRVDSDGVVAARRWYFRESIRAAPHLLRSWLRGARARDLTHIAGVVASSYVFTLIIGLFVVAPIVLVGRNALGLAGIPTDLGRLVSNDVSLAVVFLPLGALAAMTGGYIAAWLGQRAPLVSALALGLAWSSAGFIASTIDGSAPIWYRSLGALVVILGTTVGGMFRVASSPDGRVAQ